MSGYARKAALYARYRWDYASPAIQAVLDAVRLTPESAVADIGSGTGILTRHFLGAAGRVFAVEPEPAMRRQAELALSGHPAFHSLDACAEATGLPDASVDLIVAGQALHWFDPLPARGEFRRILKPGGWLAVIWNRPDDPALGAALAAACTAENGYDTAAAPRQQPLTYYFGGQDFLARSFPQAAEEDWPAFLGALLSDSRAPDEDHPLCPRLAAAARAVFDRFSAGGRVTVRYVTELRLGRMRP
jgi:SAM-dependent methyltransferase